MSDYEASGVNLDAADELHRFRDYFNFPPSKDGRRNLYLCGNSLGLQSKRAVQYIGEEMEKWADLCVHGHFQGNRPWVQYHRETKRGLAYLAGATEDEVVAMNSLTVNLHLMMVSFFRPTPTRCRILMEWPAFPSDIYAIKTHLRSRGLDPADALITVRPRAGEHTIRPAVRC